VNTSLTRLVALMAICTTAPGLAGPVEPGVPVATLAATDGPCLSYWGGHGRDWATILINESALAAMAADRTVLARADHAAQLLQAGAKGAEEKGCRTLGEVTSGQLAVILELLEAGKVVVIDDSAGRPVRQIFVRRRPGGQGKATYHLTPASDAFLVRRAPDTKPAPVRAQWSIEKEAITPANQSQLAFARKFIEACTAPGTDRAALAFTTANIQLPLETKFTVVDDDDSDTRTDLLSTLEVDPNTGKLWIPLCAGRGALDDVTMRMAGDKMLLDLSFREGLSQTLHFKRYDRGWKLSSVEWIDN
jgi:hypothetical protein